MFAIVYFYVYNILIAHYQTMPLPKTKPNVLIVGSGQMGQRIHEQWIEKYNLLNNPCHIFFVRKSIFC